MDKQEILDLFEKITGHNVAFGDPEQIHSMFISANEVQEFAEACFNAGVAREREECAKLCESAAHPESRWELAWASIACAKAIRAREIR